MTDVARRLVSWHARHGRSHLPWQRNKTPYRVWLSEIMLQQTQAATVVPYFERFTTRFVDVNQLAAARQDDVLHLWTGLGYYARARNLHKAAQVISEEYDGEFPNDQEALEALPGVGRSTAAAIRAISFGARAAILDGNVKRVLARHHMIEGHTARSATQKVLWQFAEQHTPARDVDTYTQAIMDLGATICTPRSPSCLICPLSTTCAAHAADAADRFPEKKPKKQKPERDAQLFLVVASDGTCLLERQPERGIWGGLWSPPVREEDFTQEALATELAAPELFSAPSQKLPTFRHTFTHYHLNITPVLIRLPESAPLLVTDDAHRMWFHTRDNRPIGLSAPAVKLLATLSKERSV